MRYPLVALAVLVAMGRSETVDAGPHLGMKLACKRYSEAWNSASKGALHGVTTSEFARIWDRVPAEKFALLPRGGSGKVAGSRKGRGSGSVTVSTSQGMLTFVLVGKGFRWTVADIHKAGDDGRTVSVKNYLDASLTAGEFMEDLKYAGGTSFHDSISPEFRQAFVRLSSDDLERVRRFLPDVNKNVDPYVIMRGDSATVRVQVPGQGPNDYATFSLVRRGGWRVDDYSIDSREVSIASFREALPAIACVAAFGDFVAAPDQEDPCGFTSEGELREELLAARDVRPFPIVTPPVRESFVITDGGCCVEIRYPNKMVRMELSERDGGRALRKIETFAGDRWVDVAGVLSLGRKVRSASFASMFRSFRNPVPQPESVLTNANEIESTTAATESAPGQAIHAVAMVETVPQPVATPAIPEAQPAIFVQSPRMVRHSIQPVQHVFSSKRQWKRWRRSMRRSRR